MYLIINNYTISYILVKILYNICILIYNIKIVISFIIRLLLFYHRTFLLSYKHFYKTYYTTNKKEPEIKPAPFLFILYQINDTHIILIKTNIIPPTGTYCIPISVFKILNTPSANINKLLFFKLCTPPYFNNPYLK